MGEGVNARLRSVPVRDLGLGVRLVMDGGNKGSEKGNSMAEDESVLVNPPTQEMATHVHDYTRFTKLFKWGAIICLIIAFIVLMILK